MQYGKQVGSFTMILADAIYRRFLVDQAIQTDKEYKTDTIYTATTIDSATAPAPAPAPAPANYILK